MFNSVFFGFFWKNMLTIFYQLFELVNWQLVYSVWSAMTPQVYIMGLQLQKHKLDMIESCRDDPVKTKDCLPTVTHRELYICKWITLETEVFVVQSLITYLELKSHPTRSPSPQAPYKIWKKRIVLFAYKRTQRGLSA